MLLGLGVAELRRPPPEVRPRLAVRRSALPLHQHRAQVAHRVAHVLLGGAAVPPARLRLVGGHSVAVVVAGSELYFIL